MQSTQSTLYILDASTDITGAFICAKNEAKLLSKSQRVVLVLPSNSQIADEALVSFDQVIKLPIYNLRKSVQSVLIYIPMLLLSSWKLKNVMKKDNCAYLQVNDYYLMQGAMAKIFGFRGKVVTWVRIDPRRYGSFISKFWLKYTYKYSTSVVSVSKFIYEALPKSAKNRIIYDAVPYEGIVNKPQTDPKHIVYIANYIEGKGQQYAIEAFAKVVGECKKVELHFYGGDMGLEKNKKFRQYLVQLIRDNNLSGEVFLHDFTNKTQKILQNAYMALNFSESESFSMTCLEASVCGIPVIATKSGGPEEIIDNNVTGFLVDKGDITAMSNAIMILLQDDPKCLIMGENAREYVLGKFSVSQFSKSINEVFP